MNKKEIKALYDVAYRAGHRDIIKENQARYRNKVKNTPLFKFKRQRDKAALRGIGWKLSFDEWWSIWESSGKWEKRGSGAGKFVMCRTADKGDYAVGNVRIDTFDNNVKEALHLRRVA